VTRRSWWLVPYGWLLAVGGLVALGVWQALDAAADGEPLHWESRAAWLLAGGCALLCWVGFHLRASRAATLLYSRVGDLGATRPGLFAHAAPLPVVLRIVAVGLLVAALARPQTYRTEVRLVEGIDVMVVLDLSKSMEEKDLKRDRLDAGQRTIREFLRGRESDRIGLVVFAREALLQCPLTLDYRSLEQIVADLAIGDVPEMGTAIGDALGLALAQLKRSEARSKVVILLSDGDSNVVNVMDPGEAKALAKRMGVKVFTVLMGREKGAPELAGKNQYAVNPELLKQIASDTGGLFFNAGDDAALTESFDRIRAELEKTEVKVVGITADRELFPRLVVPALLLLLLELALVMTRLRRFP
jgi:Ca-activated chloride channel family protein